MKNFLILLLLSVFINSYSNDSLNTDISNHLISSTSKDTSSSIDFKNQTNTKSSKIKAQKEKAIKDSIEFEREKASVVLRNTLEKGIMTIHPKSSDSIISYDKIYPHHVMQTEGFNFSDILNKNPFFIPVLRNVSSSYNNSLYLGIPVPILKIQSTDQLVGPYPYRVPYQEYFSPKEIYSLDINSSAISAKQFPQDFLVPQISLLYEGGLGGFRQNMLNVRFTRAMTERIQLGVFSNFQHFNRVSYSHDNGQINNFYKGIYKNPFDAPIKLMSDTGTNPYTNEFVAAAKLLYLSKKDSKLRFTYSYSDVRNDFPKIPVDTIIDNDSILWKEDINYQHRINASLSEVKLSSNLYFNSQIFLNQHKNRLYPTIPTDKIAYKGEKFTAGGGIHPYLLIGNKDTASIKFTAQRDATERYNNQEFISQDIRILGNYYKNFNFGKLSGQAILEAGGLFVKMNDKRESNLHLSFDSNLKLGKGKLSLNAAHTIMPPQVPFETENSIKPGNLVDKYYSFGGNFLFRGNMNAISLGYKGLRDLKERTDSLYWSPGIPPYKTAKNNFIVAPSLFTGKTVSLSSTWIFTDSKPYIKSKSSLLFHIHRKNRVQHTFLSLDFMYWSKRDSSNYAGVTEWNREIYDINFHTTVQIKTFRLYYKIDNIINRQNTFAPGFYMPGLILRWGFNWQITG